jgi:hypothetical protein
MIMADGNFIHARRNVILFLTRDVDTAEQSCMAARTAMMSSMSVTTISALMSRSVSARASSLRTMARR